LLQQQRTSNLGVSLGLDLVEDGKAVLDKIGQGRELQERKNSSVSIVVEESWSLNQKRNTSSEALPPPAFFSLGCFAGLEGRLWAGAPSAALGASTFSEDIVGDALFFWCCDTAKEKKVGCLAFPS
jgi:hypothetical protein